MRLLRMVLRSAVRKAVTRSSRASGAPSYDAVSGLHASGKLSPGGQGSLCWDGVSSCSRGASCAHTVRVTGLIWLLSILGQQLAAAIHKAWPPESRLG